MAKNTSKKIKELKGIKPEKISDEHLQEVKGVINDINKFQLDLGILETKKHSLLHHISTLQEKVGDMQVKFEKEYGTSDINLETGVINYEKENGEADKED